MSIPTPTLGHATFAADKDGITVTVKGQPPQAIPCPAESAERLVRLIAEHAAYELDRCIAEAQNAHRPRNAP